MTDSTPGCKYDNYSHSSLIAQYAIVAQAYDMSSIGESVDRPCLSLHDNSQSGIKKMIRVGFGGASSSESFLILPKMELATSYDRQGEEIRYLRKQLRILTNEVTQIKQHHSPVQTNIIEIIDLPFDEVKTRVLNYYNKYGEKYPDEIAVELRLDLEMVMRAVQELLVENKLEVIK